MVFSAGVAECQKTRVTIQSVSVSIRQDATAIVIETSGDTPIRVEPGSDRVDIDFPQAEWRAKPPRVDRRNGLIESFRKVPAAEGVHLVFMTRTGYGLHDSGPVAVEANGGRIITVTLGAPSTAPLVTVTGDGPVVIEGSGYIPPSPNTKSAPASVVQPAVQCAPKLTQQGSIDGKPVLGFGGCPPNAAP